MTSKIWDEMPTLEKLKKEVDNWEWVRHTYPKRMDAWLEKVKERLDLLESIEGAELVGLFGIDGAGLQIIDKYKVEVLEEKAGYWEGHLSILIQLGAMMTDSAVYDMGKLADILKTLPELIEKADEWEAYKKDYPWYFEGDKDDK